MAVVHFAVMCILRPLTWISLLDCRVLYIINLIAIFRSRGSHPGVHIFPSEPAFAESKTRILGRWDLPVLMFSDSIALPAATDQKEAARLIAVDPSTLARWERGEKELTGAFAKRAELQ